MIARLRGSTQNNSLGVAAVGHRKDAGGIALQQQARIEPTHAGRKLQDFAHLVLRAAQADAFVGFDEWTVDQDRMLHHRVENRVVGDVRIGQAKLLRQRLLGAQALARGNPGAVVEALQLVPARRSLSDIR